MIQAVLAKERVDAIIVRDITLSLTALRAARARRIPVVLDMAEPYPEMIRAQHAYGDLWGFRKLVRSVRLAEWVERQTLKRVAMTFAMIEESRARIVGMGIPKEKVCIVSNTPDLKKFQNGRPTYPGSMARFKDNTIFLYIGFLDLYRGVQVAIQGFPMVLKEEPNSVLFLVGSGKAEHRLRRLSKKLGIHERVVFEGYQSHSLIPDYVASCDVGIIPHYSCGLWNHTIPNKLFDYMAMSKPVLSSDATPVKRIVEKEDCGAVYENNDPCAFAREAKKLLDRDHRKMMGEKARIAVQRRYNWKIDAEMMMESIKNVITQVPA
jgi:glycosyltransferase involved in cell wall biosynthesis